MTFGNDVVREGDVKGKRRVGARFFEVRREGHLGLRLEIETIQIELRVAPLGKRPVELCPELDAWPRLTGDRVGAPRVVVVSLGDWKRSGQLR